MNKRQRIAAAIGGERTDRVPRAFWQPRGAGTGDAERDAGKAFSFWRSWDTDLIITVNESGYSCQDYEVPAVTRNGGVSYSADPDDWRRMRPLSVNGGSLGRALETLKCLLEKVQGEAPVLFRVMSPVASLLQMAPQAGEDIRRGYGETVKEALKTMTETACALVQRAVELGADGIFLEAPCADYGEMPESLYREYGVSYDLAVLSASAGWCNAVCAGVADCMFPLIRKYPAQILAWDASQSLPEPMEARALTGRCVMTGLNRRYLEFGMKNQVERDLYRILTETRGEGLILSAGASVQPHRGMAAFFRRSSLEIEEKVLAHR